MSESSTVSLVKCVEIDRSFLFERFLPTLLFSRLVSALRSASDLDWSISLDVCLHTKAVRSREDQLRKVWLSNAEFKYGFLVF